MKQAMMSRRTVTLSLAVLATIAIFTTTSQAGLSEIRHDLEIFTNDGAYNDSDAIDLYFDVSDTGGSQVDFIFHNESLVDCSISEIYFEDNDSIMDYLWMTEGPGTAFDTPATPANLPSGNTLSPAFTASLDLTYDSDPPVSSSGINPGEWLGISLGLNCTFAALVEKLSSGDIRVGAHVIALPDGSSESAVYVPEPMTVSMLGFGALCMAGKARTW